MTGPLVARSGGRPRERPFRCWRITAVVAAALVVITALWLVRPDDGPVRPDPSTSLPADRARIDPSRVGFSPGADLLWMSTAEQNHELDLMAATGAHWLRLDFPWPSVEPADNAWNWAPFDKIVSAAQERGFEIVGIPGYGPDWAARAASRGVPPVSTSAWSDFVAHLVARYGPTGVQVWELWNEPNLRGAWGANPDPAAYTELLVAGAAAARRADPEARVLSGGLAPAVDAGDGSEVSPVTFVEGIYAASGGSALDAVAVHPYSYPAAPRDPSTASWNTYARLPLVHDVMAAHGDGAKKVWITEFGAPTGTASGAVSESAQAAMVQQGLTGTGDWAWAGPIFWYAARDRGTNLADREANFGLLRHDFSAKPAYAVFAATVAG